MIFTPRWYAVTQVALIITGQLRSIKDGGPAGFFQSGLGPMFKIAPKFRGHLVTNRRANDEGSIFPYRKGFAAYVWITTPSDKRQRKYVYGRTREIVHGRWVELTRKAARGPVVTKVPTVGQFLHQWLEETVAPNLRAPRADD